MERTGAVTCEKEPRICREGDGKELEGEKGGPMTHEHYVQTDKEKRNTKAKEETVEGGKSKDGAIGAPGGQQGVIALNQR